MTTSVSFVLFCYLSSRRQAHVQPPAFIKRGGEVMAWRKTPACIENLPASYMILTIRAIAGSERRISSNGTQQSIDHMIADRVRMIDNCFFFMSSGDMSVVISLFYSLSRRWPACVHTRHNPRDSYSLFCCCCCCLASSAVAGAGPDSATITPGISTSGGLEGEPEADASTYLYKT